MPLNHAALQGNLTRDPESRAAGQSTVVAFTIASTQKRSGGEDTCFLDCEAWGKTGELVQQYLTKGASCIVEGRLKQEQWQDKDGNKRSRIKIVADRVHFLAQRQGAQQADDAAPRAERPAPATGGGSAGSDDLPFARSEMEVMP